MIFGRDLTIFTDQSFWLTFVIDTSAKALLLSTSDYMKRLNVNILESPTIYTCRCNLECLAFWFVFLIFFAVRRCSTFVMSPFVLLLRGFTFTLYWCYISTSAQRHCRAVECELRHTANKINRNSDSSKAKDSWTAGMGRNRKTYTKMAAEIRHISGESHGPTSRQSNA